MADQLTEFREKLSLLLPMLADPVTPHTSKELWCRIGAFRWDECVLTLRQALKSDDPSVIRLVLSVLNEQADVYGLESINEFLPDILVCLNHDDRLVRNDAILLVQDVQIADSAIVEAMNGIVHNDEPLLAREALIALLNVDETIVEEILAHLRLPAS